MINRVMMGDPSIREITDNDSITLSYAEVKALAAGNPLILEKANVEAEIARMRRARSNFLDRQIRARGERADYPRRLAAAEEGLAAAMADLARREDTNGDAFRIVIGDQEYRTRPEAGTALRRVMEEGCHRARRRETIPVGKFAGFDLFGIVHPQADTSVLLRGERDYEQDVQLFQSPVHLMMGVEAMPRRIDGIIASLEQQVAYLRTQVAHLEALKEEPFPQEAKLLGLVERLREIETSLRIEDRGQRATMGALDIATAEEEPEDDEAVPAAA
jgi:hypothetical protein